MRDSKRIFDVTATLATGWLYCPDLRFMQLIENFKAWYQKDVFYLEDDEFLEAFQQYIIENT